VRSLRKPKERERRRNYKTMMEREEKKKVRMKTAEERGFVKRFFHLTTRRLQVNV